MPGRVPATAPFFDAVHVLCGAFARDLLEHFGKIERVFIPHLLRDLAHEKVCVPHQGLGALYAKLRHILARRHAVFRFEDAADVRRHEAEFLRQDLVGYLVPEVCGQILFHHHGKLLLFCGRRKGALHFFQQKADLAFHFRKLKAAVQDIAQLFFHAPVRQVCGALLAQSVKKVLEHHFHFRKLQRRPGCIFQQMLQRPHRVGWARLCTLQRFIHRGKWPNGRLAVCAAAVDQERRMTEQPVLFNIVFHLVVYTSQFGKRECGSKQQRCKPAAVRLQFAMERPR